MDREAGQSRRAAATGGRSVPSSCCHGRSASPVELQPRTADRSRRAAATGGRPVPSSCCHGRPTSPVELLPRAADQSRRAAATAGPPVPSSCCHGWPTSPVELQPRAADRSRRAAARTIELPLTHQCRALPSSECSAGHTTGVGTYWLLLSSASNEYSGTAPRTAADWMSQWLISCHSDINFPRYLVYMMGQH